MLGGNPGSPEAVIPELGADPSCRGAPADHRIGVRLRQHYARQFAGAAADSAEQRPYWKQDGRTRSKYIGKQRPADA